MNFHVPSKICLSLREINFDNIEYYRKISNLVEIRLDCISLTNNELKSLCDLFDYVILKSYNLNNYNSSKYSDEIIKYSNIILDFDYNLFANNINSLKLNELVSDKIIISKHNIVLALFEEQIVEIINITEEINPLMYKFVLKENSLENSKKIISRLYDFSRSSLKENVDLIIFAEGEKNIDTRYFSIEIGAPYTYCALDESTRTGVGQPTYKEAEIEIQIRFT
jgi:3-dehydroquinate dehydratase